MQYMYTTQRKGTQSFAKEEHNINSDADQTLLLFHSFPRQSGSATPAADAEYEAAAAAAAAAADNELLLAELASFSEEELLACLQDRDDTQAGSKQQMIERLAALIVAEAERWVHSWASHASSA